jgi:hypothetical protein
VKKFIELDAQLSALVERWDNKDFFQFNDKTQIKFSMCLSDNLKN